MTSICRTVSRSLSAIWKKEEQGKKEEADLALLKEQLSQVQEEEEDSKLEADALTASLSHLETEIEGGKNEIIRLLNQRASTKAKLQRYDTMLEQINIRKVQLSQRVLKLKSQESEQEIT